MDILPAVLHQDLRHTGARCFVRSSTVSNDGAVSRNFIEMLFHIVGGSADRSGQFRRRFTPSVWIARVDECKHLAAIHTLLNFINSNSGCFHRSLLDRYSMQLLRLTKARHEVYLTVTLTVRQS